MRNIHIYKEIRGFHTEIFESLSVRHIILIYNYFFVFKCMVTIMGPQ